MFPNRLCALADAAKTLLSSARTTADPTVIQHATAVATAAIQAFADWLGIPTRTRDEPENQGSPAMQSQPQALTMPSLDKVLALLDQIEAAIRAWQKAASPAP